MENLASISLTEENPSRGVRARAPTVAKLRDAACNVLRIAAKTARTGGHIRPSERYIMLAWLKAMTRQAQRACRNALFYPAVYEVLAKLVRRLNGADRWMVAMWLWAVVDQRCGANVLICRAACIALGVLAPHLKPSERTQIVDGLLTLAVRADEDLSFRCTIYEVLGSFFLPVRDSKKEAIVALLRTTIARQDENDDVCESACNVITRLAPYLKATDQVPMVMLLQEIYLVNTVDSSLHEAANHAINAIASDLNETELKSIVERLWGRFLEEENSQVRKNVCKALAMFAPYFLTELDQLVIVALLHAIAALANEDDSVRLLALSLILELTPETPS